GIRDKLVTGVQTCALPIYIISGNTQRGVRITGVGSDVNVVAGNYIGLMPDGTTALANGIDGVLIDNGPKYNRIGTNGDGLGTTRSEERRVGKEGRLERAEG